MVKYKTGKVQQSNMEQFVRSVTILRIAGTPVSANSLDLAGDSGGEVSVLFASSPSAAQHLLETRNIGAILLTLPIPGYSPEAVLREIRRRGHAAPAVIQDPRDAPSLSGELAQLGAFQCVSASASPERLREALFDAIRGQREAVSRTATESRARNAMVGSSSAMRQVTEIIRLVGPRRSTVLITGETGSGKEVAARAIHAASSRPGSRMVAINCAALPDNLLEAELFGHTKGAFTGAVNARVGLFEQAHRGTIFLDEISELPLQLQSKLLRVLQEREIQRVGSSEIIPVDVRVIAASNTNLLEAVASRRFREDLYYRLNVVALRIPPLRERASDIPELAEHFLAKIAVQEGGERKRLADAAVAELMRYSWPGNVRQLEHALESAVALSGDRVVLHPSDLDLPSETS
jgi:two-component system response regulator HydG